MDNIEIENTYTEYINLCIEKIDLSAIKWNKIILVLDEFSDELLEKNLLKMLSDIEKIDDVGRILIKNELRYVIYRHRYYCNAYWAMSENRICKLEDAMNKINTVDPIYEYLYLFSSKYEFPLLNPIPYDRENLNKNYKEENEKLRENEIENGIGKFKNRGLSLKKLLELSSKSEYPIIGECIAQYYDKGEFCSTTIELIMNVDSTGRILFDYVRYFVRNGKNIIKETIDIVRKKQVKQNIIVDLLLLEPLGGEKQSLIDLESDEIKREFWGRPVKHFLYGDKKILRWAINECQKYGTLSTYLEILFDAKELLSIDEIYEALIKIEQVRVEKLTAMSDYYLKQVLLLLQNKYIGDEEKYKNIAEIEWLFRNLLDWEEMKCVQYFMKKSPLMYAELVDIIYLKEGETKENRDIKKREIAEKVGDFFYKAHFCPAESNGQVNYNDLKKWIDEFRELLVKQQQVHLFGYFMGSLLVYSPIGADGYMPCESVRKFIESIDDESFKREYITQEINKRGIYSPNAGKSEIEISRKYKENADVIRDDYPYTAEIYDELSKHYKIQAENERRRAEDEW